MKDRLITGGSGKLGTELQRGLLGLYPTREEFDVVKDSHIYSCDQVIHLAAYTDVAKAEVEKKACFELNVGGTFNMLKLYGDKPFVYMSTEWANKPMNVYSWSKYLAEILVKNLAERHLIIRTSFKPNPYPWDVAFRDHITQGDYIDVIAPLVIDEINRWDEISKLVWIGTGRKTMYELALRTKPGVKPNSVEDIKDVFIPKDYL